MTDSEGYIVNLDDWSEPFAYAQALVEGLDLTEEHWEIIRFLRDYYQEHGVQCEVRKMVKHFKLVWGGKRRVVAPICIAYFHVEDPKSREIDWLDYLEQKVSTKLM